MHPPPCAQASRAVVCSSGGDGVLGMRKAGAAQYLLSVAFLAKTAACAYHTRGNDVWRDVQQLNNAQTHWHLQYHMAASI
jgi:hypothetical protein